MFREARRPSAVQRRAVLTHAPASTAAGTTAGIDGYTGLLPMAAVTDGSDMLKNTFAAALALSLASQAATADPAIAAPSPDTATRLGHRLRSTRVMHCERKADSVGVQGKAREIYMRKCTKG